MLRMMVLEGLQDGRLPHQHRVEVNHAIANDDMRSQHDIVEEDSESHHDSL